jgi:PRC-barrel domain
MRNALLTSAAVLGLAFAMPAYAQTGATTDTPTAVPPAGIPGDPNAPSIGEVHEEDRGQSYWPAQPDPSDTTAAGTAMTDEDRAAAAYRSRFVDPSTPGQMFGEYDTSEMISAPVYDQAGQQVGEIIDFVERTGEPDAVVIRSSGYMGGQATPHLMIVPATDVVRAEGAEGDWIVNRSDDDIRNMPRYELREGAEVQSR